MGVQISSVHFPKDGSSCEWFIMKADFDGFREVKHFNNIQFISLHCLKNLDFYCVWNVEFCVNQAARREVLIFCFNWKKSAAEAHRMLVEVYDGTAPTDKSCREWFRRFKDGDFSWRQASLWIAKKIRRQRIRGITRRRSESNAKGACRIIGGNSTSRFYMIESHGNDSKTRKLDALWTENRETLKGDFSLVDSKTTEKRFFCIGLWLKMRSGYSTITPRRKNTTLSLINCCHRPQHQHHGRTFVVHRSCSVSGWTKRIFTISCWNLAIPLRVIGIGYNWFVWVVHWEKRPEYEQRHNSYSSSWQRSASCR